MLRFRDGALAAVDALLAAAWAGCGGALVASGEPGIGKSTLLRAAAARAETMRVLSTGVEAESTLGYATLQRLLQPLLPLLPAVPAPQASALAIALGLQDGPAPDRFLVALAALTLLSEAAAEQPVLCLVDDLHWANHPSRAALGFVARRVAAEPIALLLTTRQADQAETAGLCQVPLERLDATKAEALLDERWGARLAPSARAAVIEHAAGNPLALLELPTLLTEPQRAGQAPLPRPLPLAGQLERAFASTLAGLSAEAQTIALLCAAEGSGSASTVLRAAAGLGASPPLESLRRGPWLIFDGRTFQFRHPLVASAIYQHATPAARRAAHLALAEALAADDAQADRRAWHRAQSAVGPDEAIAAELEQRADRTLRRSGYAAATQALEHAAELSPAEPDRVRRLVAAAEAAWQGGETPRAQALLQRAEQLGLDDAATRLRARHLQGAIQLRSGVAADGFATLLAASAEAAAIDPPLALRMLAAAGEAAFQAGDVDAVTKISAVLQQLPERAELGPRLFRRLYLALRSTSRLDESLQADLSAAEQVPDPDLLVTLGGLAFGLGEYAAARRLWTTAVAHARALGAAGALAGALRTLALDELSRSRYAWAEASAAEGRALALETGQPNLACQHAAILAEVAGLRGREDDARRAADAVLVEAAARGLPGTMALVRRGLGQLALAWGRPAEAIAHFEVLWSLHANSQRGVALAMVPDMVEAGVRAGRPDLARAWLERLPVLDDGRSREAHAAATRARALLAPGDTAEGLFQQALGLYAGVERPLEQARTQLLFGEYLRRARRRVAARAHLRAALAAFEQLGAIPWAERARGELRATGETARKRDPSTLEQLTRQELQVARVVAQGASNREAAAQLFISPRTVDHHLRSVFQKLGISSRGELIHRVATEAPLR